MNYMNLDFLFADGYPYFFDRLIRFSDELVLVSLMREETHEFIDYVTPPKKGIYLGGRALVAGDIRKRSMKKAEVLEQNKIPVKRIPRTAGVIKGLADWNHVALISHQREKVLVVCPVIPSSMIANGDTVTVSNFEISLSTELGESQ